MWVHWISGRTHGFFHLSTMYHVPSRTADAQSDPPGFRARMVGEWQQNAHRHLSNVAGNGGCGECIDG